MYMYPMCIDSKISLLKITSFSLITLEQKIIIGANFHVIDKKSIKTFIFHVFKFSVIILDTRLHVRVFMLIVFIFVYRWRQIIHL